MNQEIYTAIRERILFLEYRPGDILNEKILADEFGVSRTPLREVLNRLEFEELVRVLPRTGTMITEVEFQKIMHVFQVRLGIEALTGRLAAENITGEQLQRLHEVGLRCSDLLDRREKRELVAMDFNIRNILHEAVANPVLTRISEQLYALTFRLWYLILERGEWAEEVKALHGEVQAIHHVLSSRNPAAAEALRRDYLMQHLERIRQKFLSLTV